PDGHWLAAALPGSVKVFSLPDANEVATVPGPSRIMPRLMAFSADSKHLFVPHEKFAGAVELWDTRTWQRAGTRTLAPQNLHVLAASPTEDLVACIAKDGILRVTDGNGNSRWAHPERLLPSALIANAVTDGAIAFSPAGKQLAVANGQGLIHIFNTAS